MITEEGKINLFFANPRLTQHEVKVKKISIYKKHNLYGLSNPTDKHIHLKVIPLMRNYTAPFQSPQRALLIKDKVYFKGNEGKMLILKTPSADNP